MLNLGKEEKGNWINGNRLHDAISTNHRQHVSIWPLLHPLTSALPTTRWCIYHPEHTNTHRPSKQECIKVHTTHSLKKVWMQGHRLSMYTQKKTVKVWSSGIYGETLHLTWQKCPHTDYAFQSFPLFQVDFCIISHVLSLITDWYQLLLQSIERENITQRKRNKANPMKIKRVISKRTFSTIGTHVIKAAPQNHWNINYWTWWCCTPTKKEFIIGTEGNTNTRYL